MKEDNGMVKTPKTPTDGNSQIFWRKIILEKDF
jgi:hypothetical protein